jgi:hypothetical protein
MNNLNYDMQNSISKFLTFLELTTYRLCNKNLSNQITHIIFIKKEIDVNKISRKNMHKFIDFIRKYKLYINIINLRGMMQLSNFLSTDDYEMHPKVLRSIRFDDSFNNELKYNLPANILTVSFGLQFTKALTPRYFPDTLTKLDFSKSRFNEELKLNDLPSNLIELIFGSCFNKKIHIGILPQTLTLIRFGYDFNQVLEPNTFPTSLTHLTFGHNFNQPLIHGVLPIGLTYLYLNDCFNQEILSKVIPNTLQVLRIAYTFNKKFNKDNIPTENLQCIMVQNGYRCDKEFPVEVAFEHFSKN